MPCSLLTGYHLHLARECAAALPFRHHQTFRRFIGRFTFVRLRKPHVTVVSLPSRHLLSPRATTSTRKNQMTLPRHQRKQKAPINRGFWERAHLNSTNSVRLFHFSSSLSKHHGRIPLRVARREAERKAFANAAQEGRPEVTKLIVPYHNSLRSNNKSKTHKQALLPR